MDKVAHVTTGDRLTNRNLWTFAAGGVGRDMAYNLWNGSLLICIMYTKSVNASQLSIIMVMMTLCRIWDAINDPVMGGIIERTRTKWGKFKPWVFIGAVTNALVTFSIFAVPLQGRDFVIFFPFAYLLWDITYTMNDIGYWAMLPSLSSNDQDRNKLSTWAIILGGIGSGIAGIIIPIATIGSNAIGGNAIKGFIAIAAIIGVMFIGCQTMTCLCVKEKPLAPLAKEDKIGVKAMFKVIFKNKQLLWIAVVMIFYNLGNSLNYASITNFVYFRFGYEGGNASLFGTLGGLLGGVSIVFPMLAKRFTRKQISLISIIGAAIGYILLFVIGTTTIAAANSKLIFTLLILCYAIVVCGQTMFNMVVTVSIANTIEYNEWTTGNRDEGIIFSVRPFMSKLGSALVAVVQLFVYGVWRGNNGKSVADYTNGISQLENTTNLLLANESNILATGGTPEQAEAMNSIIEQAGMSFEEAQNALIASGKDNVDFAAVIGKLKAVAIDNTLADVESGALIWMLFCLSIIPMIFVVLGYLIWVKKYKIDETKYAQMVKEIAERNGVAIGDESADVDGNVDAAANEEDYDSSVKELSDDDSKDSNGIDADTAEDTVSADTDVEIVEEEMDVSVDTDDAE